MTKKAYLSLLLAFMMAIFFVAPAAATSADQSVPAGAAKQMLMDGNQRYISGSYAHPEIGQSRRSELSKGQHPFAVIVSCSDSRVPPELVFDQGLGDLFVVRVAGNVLDAIELGSVEYAVEHLGAKLVVVLGHEKCGAVKATVDGGEVPPNIQAIAAKIRPAVAAAKAMNSASLYEATANVNVTNMVEVIQADPIIAHNAGVQIVGAKYHLESGEVEFFNSGNMHPAKH